MKLYIFSVSVQIKVCYIIENTYAVHKINTVSFLF